MATFPQNRPFSGAGHDLGPLPRPLKLPRLARGQDVEDLSGLSMVVIDFEVAAVHELVSPKQGPTEMCCWVSAFFAAGKAAEAFIPSTLKVYVAALVAHRWILKGTRRLNYPRSCFILSWDLSVGLKRALFEPFKSVELSTLSFEDGPPVCTHFHQEGCRPASILC